MASKLIVFVGAPEVGKDTIADLICAQDARFQHFKSSDLLYDFAEKVFPQLESEFMEKVKPQNLTMHTRGNLYTGYEQTGRQFMIDLANWLRANFGNDVLPKQTVDRINNSEAPFAIVSGCANAQEIRDLVKLGKSSIHNICVVELVRPRTTWEGSGRESPQYELASLLTYISVSNNSEGNPQKAVNHIFYTLGPWLNT